MSTEILEIYSHYTGTCIAAAIAALDQNTGTLYSAFIGVRWQE